MDQKTYLHKILFRLYTLKAQGGNLTLEEVERDTRQKLLAWFAALAADQRARIPCQGDVPTPEEFLAFLFEEISASL